jgi:hypothetical protein
MGSEPDTKSDRSARGAKDWCAAFPLEDLITQQVTERARVVACDQVVAASARPHAEQNPIDNLRK